MEMLSLKECQQAMAALDAADKLNASVENELSQFKKHGHQRDYQACKQDAHDG